MLLFACARGDSPLQRSDEPAVRLWTSLEAAERDCAHRILVIDGHALSEEVSREGLDVESVPAEAILNGHPYLPPRPVTAAGGYVVRSGSLEPEVLLIFRRGVWDLPKGKLDEGETVRECALREVREEIGINDLRMRRPLGTTMHGYANGDVFSVKTTYWFLMETAEDAFVPQAEEQIEEVTWVAWSEAKDRIGFETLREHMRRVEDEVRILNEPG